MQKLAFQDHQFSEPFTDKQQVAQNLQILSKVPTILNFGPFSRKSSLFFHSFYQTFSPIQTYNSFNIAMGMGMGDRVESHQHVYVGGGCFGPAAKPEKYASQKAKGRAINYQDMDNGGYETENPESTPNSDSKQTLRQLTEQRRLNTQLVDENEKFKSENQNLVLQNKTLSKNHKDLQEVNQKLILQNIALSQKHEKQKEDNRGLKKAKEEIINHDLIKRELCEELEEFKKVEQELKKEIANAAKKLKECEDKNKAFEKQISLIKSQLKKQTEQLQKFREQKNREDTNSQLTERTYELKIKQLEKQVAKISNQLEERTQEHLNKIHENQAFVNSICQQNENMKALISRSGISHLL